MQNPSIELFHCCTLHSEPVDTRAVQAYDKIDYVFLLGTLKHYAITARPV